ncbi:MAG: MotA/TolQ/ExbB proton channel family protein [Desulfobacterales bacterium]|nr:MotA/TolQ/ExbB proton channel family protein [Desulfobacterales bacterium]
MMQAFGSLYQYIGPALWLLMPLSVITLGMLFYVFHCIWVDQNINEWVEVLLAHVKETATLVGLLGSVYALTSSFSVAGAPAEEIRQRMFYILSTGFWSTIAGVLVSIEASIGLLAMKRT